MQEEEPTKAATLGPGEGWWLAGLALAALAVRLALARLPHVLQADEGAYVWLGRNLVTGQGFTFIGIPEVHYTPLFPALCGLLYLISGSLEAASKALFVVLGAGLVVPVYLLARAVYGLRAARVAGLLVAALPALTSHVLYWGSMSEPLYLFLLFWGLWLVWRAWREGGTWLHAGAALLLSLAYLARPEGLIYVGAALAFLGLARVRELRRHAWSLAAYALVFVLVAAPYVLYLHAHTGEWMLTGKVWTAYAQDRALAGKDWVTFDRMTWGLDSSGEVLYHSRERFNRSLGSYIVAEPRAFLRGLLDNTRTLPQVLLGRQGVPRPLLVAVVLGLFAQAWTRRRARREVFLGGAALVPVVTFSAVMFSVRFLQPVFPLAMIWAARGLVGLGEWLAETVRAQGGRVGMWGARVLVALPAVAAALYLVAVQPAVVRQGAAQMKFHYKAAGEWLATHTAGDAVIMSRGAIAAIHAEREWSPLPHAAWSEIVAYGRRRGATHLVVNDQELRQFQPHLEALCDESQPPPELEHLYTYRDAHGRTIIYRFRP